MRCPSMGTTIILCEVLQASSKQETKKLHKWEEKKEKWQSTIWAIGPQWETITLWKYYIKNCASRKDVTVIRMQEGKQQVGTTINLCFTFATCWRKEATNKQNNNQQWGCSWQQKNNIQNNQPGTI